MAEFAKGAAILATHQAAQLEWLSHAVKGFGSDFNFDRAPGEAVMRQIKPKGVSGI